ncbi:hypothetical protein QYE76_057161 [Lolium multiflorum]|uniref:Protein kinase domain-containing protein n=1 Tax=Lolium multiflorum TaxID=4521 RepID=A0AAD8T3C4_LOLMU|nr:hypothetical protein QYE76_057161 [Lolium multiflorum]
MLPSDNYDPAPISRTIATPARRLRPPPGSPRRPRCAPTPVRGAAAGGAGFRTDPDVIRPWGRPAARMDGSRAAAAAAAPGGGGRPWDDAHGDGERAEEEGGEVSLRAWLDRPGRAVEATECLHVFRQVAEAVSVAHAQGVAVGSARPSCFVVSPPFARVAFIESASGSDASGSDASEEDGADHDAADAQPPRRPNSNGAAQARDSQHKGFPLKSVLAMELNWYTSPEESDDGPAGATFASDVYRLGVLLFELFCSFETLEEKMRAMANLRYRVLPPQLLGLAKQAVLRSGYLVMEIIISDEKVDIMTEDFDRFSSIIRRVESLRKLAKVSDSQEAGFELPLLSDFYKLAHKTSGYLFGAWLPYACLYNNVLRGQSLIIYFASSCNKRSVCALAFYRLTNDLYEEHYYLCLILSSESREYHISGYIGFGITTKKEGNKGIFSKQAADVQHLLSRMSSDADARPRRRQAKGTRIGC